jgi:hypothetical protein
VQGRITERQLPEAEQSMPGITQFYAELDDKPATFLDLLWAFEGRRARCGSTRKRARR